MAKAAFTIKKLESLRPKRSPYRVYDSMGPQGLNVQVSPKGRKIFNVSYRDTTTGKRHYVKVGTHPATSIALARTRAEGIWTKVEAGDSPKIKPKAPEQFATVDSLFSAYIDDAKRRGVRTVASIEGLYEANIRDCIGKMSAKDVTPVDIRELLNIIYDRGAMAVLKHTRQYLSSMFNYGIRAEYEVGRTGDKFGLSLNPVVAIPLPQGCSGVRDLYPTMEEIAGVWCHIYEHASPIAGAAIRWHLASCGQRLQETVGVLKDQLVDVNGIQCVYMERTKAGNPHIIPVGEHMAQILKEIEPFNRHSDALFPMRDSEKQPIRWRSLSGVQRKLRRSLKHGSWRLNDLRRSAKTFLGEAGVSMEHRNLMQNHGQTGVASRHYDRAKYLGIKYQVMGEWDRLMDEAIIKVKEEAAK